MWGEFKSRFGWKTCAFLIELSFGNNTEKFPLLTLSRRIALGLSLTYIPWGPEFPAFFPKEERETAAAQIAKNLKPFLSRNTMFVRFEPPWENSVQGTKHTDEGIASEKRFLKAGFKKSTVTVQPPDTVIINLNNSSDEILAQMKPKWRYNILLAEKKGVKVKKSGIEEIELFYSLLKETAIRDGIAVHSIEYYKTLFEICGNDNEKLHLYTASHEEDLLAAIVVLLRGKNAVYLYGASSNNKRNLMAPYALQWKAMKDAKEAGCENYDLFGIPANEDPSHPMAGLYRFKTGFGGQIIHRAGTWDFPYRKFVFCLFSAAEKIRKKIMNLKKRNNR